MKTDKVCSTNFQSRIYFDKKMTTEERKFAKKLLNFKFAGEPINTNKKLLKRHDLDLFFTGSKMFDPTSVGFKPQFTIFDDKNAKFVDIKTQSGRVYIGNSDNAIWSGAHRLREVISDGNCEKANYDNDIVCNSLIKKFFILLKDMTHKHY